MPERIPLGSCMKCGRQMHAEEGFVYSVCRCMGVSSIPISDAPSYLRIRLQSLETEASLRRTETTLARVRGLLRFGIGTPPKRLVEIALEEQEALERVMEQAQKPASKFEAILEDALLPNSLESS